MSDYFGLVGEKLKHSISPGIHKCIYEKIGIEACYHLFEVNREALGSAVEGLLSLGFKGVNVTIPYKTEIMKYLDEISPEAQNIGSINTIHFTGNKKIGYNTDYSGFGDMLKIFNVETRERKAVILGTGGAAKAVAQYLSDNGTSEIYLVSRDIGAAAENTAGIKPFEKCSLLDYGSLQTIPRMDIVINCTPCGMFPNIDASPIDKTVIAKFSTAVDLVYNPAETMFLKDARLLGLTTLNGLYMLVSQAVASENIWNNINMDTKLVNNIYQKMLMEAY